MKTETKMKQKTFTITFTEAELDLIYDQLNTAKLVDDTEEAAELADSISSKIASH
jgi:hypothetical protein